MPGLSDFRILVVDDEPDTLAFFSTVLEDNGATVFVAGDGDEAMDVARREHPDLITLDISMPGKDGIQVFNEMREDLALENIPVCVITGKPELRRLIYQRNVRPPEGYLDKPVNEERLVLTIRRLLSLSRRRHSVEN